MTELKPQLEVRTVAGPMVRFDPSQMRFFLDESRVIVVVWHRQKGKDFTAAGKAVDHCIRTHQDWYIISLTQRQADATFAKCRQHFEAFKEDFKLQGKRLSARDGTTSSGMMRSTRRSRRRLAY
jgi:hypothetical protein